MSEEYVEVEVDQCIKATEMAALLLIEGEEYWVPWSCFEPDTGDIDGYGDSGRCYLKESIVESKGIPHA